MAEQLDKCRIAVDSALHDPAKPWTHALEYLEQKLNVPRIYLFFGTAVFCGLYLIFGYGAQLLCNIIGVAYPAYVSIRAIESSTKLDDTKWLIYWVTFALMTIIEYFSGFLTYVIPFYWLLKCGFLLWCMFPVERNGSYIIYYQIVRPYFLKHHQAADKFIDDVVDKTRKSLGSFNKTD